MFNISSTLNKSINENTDADRNDRIMNIYNEDEMTPAIDIENEEAIGDDIENEEAIEDDIENEEVSEDDIESYVNYEVSKYERTMTEFDESGKDQVDREETSEEDSDSDEEVITDKPFNNEQMPQTFGEFAPYFKNITESLMFCWIQKHHISTQAYDELVDIICHSQFKGEDVVPNSRRFRKYRQRLPLLPIKSCQISISSKKTPSTSKDIGEAYYLSITDIIQHILNNPTLFNKLYFGPGQEVTKSKELWHGNIWEESPRFGQASITIAEETYYSGDFVVYREPSKRIGRILAIVQQDDRLKVKIQKVLTFEELPRNLQSNSRRKRSQEGEVWLLDREVNDAIVIVEFQAIVRRVLISILYYNNDFNRSSFKIREILYLYNGRWKLKNAEYSYKHPSEFAALKEPKTNSPVVRSLKILDVAQYDSDTYFYF